jgi:hypothetical protein
VQSNLLPNIEGLQPMLSGQSQSMFENPYQWWFGGGDDQAANGSANRRDQSSRGEPKDYRAASMLETGAYENEMASARYRDRTMQNSSSGVWSGTSGARRQEGRKPSKASNASIDSEDADTKDTTIGKGFSAQLKRGVAQAAKQAEDGPVRTEMVPQKDGGFIATIQKGFEGLFGHSATSKEEVLKQRGPMPALDYEAVPGDEIDQKVQYLARWLPPKLGSDLEIYRVSKGKYEIGGEGVKLKWHEWTRPDGVRCKEVFVRRTEDAQNDVKGTFEPLPLYLQHSAAVCHNLKNGHAICAIPAEKRMTFDEKGHSLVEADSDQRFSAMAMAVEHAKLREKAAIDYRKKTEDDESDDDNDEAEEPDAAFPEVPRGFSTDEPAKRPCPQLQAPPGIAPCGLSPPVGLGGVLSGQAPQIAPLGQAPPLAPHVPYGMPGMPYAQQPQPMIPRVSTGTFYGSQQGTFYGSQPGSYYGVQQPMIPVAFAR